MHITKLASYVAFILVYNVFSVHTCYAAQIFDITIDSYGALTPAYVDAAVTALETEVRANLPDADQGEFFQAMSNASVMAGKDLANDPINAIDYAMVVLGVGAGVDLNKKTFDDIKDSDGDIDINNAPGVGVQLGLGIGTHGKFLPKKYFNGERWSFFINYLPFNYEKDDINIKIRTGGLHMRYRLLNGYDVIRWKVFRLEPVYMTFGYEFNKLKGRFSDVISEDATADGGINATFSGTGVINLDVTTHSFPLSISSGITLLYLVTLYGGLGMDLNYGEGSGRGELQNSSLSITDGSGTATGTATLQIGDSDQPTLMFTRAFAGVQVNLWNLKVFVQGQKTFDRNLYGAQLGLKYFF
jgi:hypothetical protein